MALANLPIRYTYLAIFAFLSLVVFLAPGSTVTSAIFGEAEPPTLQALAKKRASADNEIVLYFANSGFIGHLVNSVCSLRAQGNEHFVSAFNLRCRPNTS